MVSSPTSKATKSHPNRICTLFSKAIIGTTIGNVTSTNSIIAAKRRGEEIGAELFVFFGITRSSAVLELGCDDELEEELVDSMVLDDGAMDVKIPSAFVLTVAAVFPAT